MLYLIVANFFLNLYFMNIFDIIIASLLLFGFVRGLLKGLFVEVASLVALIGGVYGSLHFSYFVSDWLVSRVSWDSEYISLFSFGITFILILVIISLLGKFLTKVADFASLGLLNKFVGGIFGGLKIGLLLSVLFIFFGKVNNTLPFLSEKSLSSSILYVPIKRIAPILFPSIINDSE